MLEANARDRLPKGLCHLWLEAGYTAQEKGAGWVRKVLGWSAQIVRDPPKMAPEEVMRAWVREFNKEKGSPSIWISCWRRRAREPSCRKDG